MALLETQHVSNHDYSFQQLRHYTEKLAGVYQEGVYGATDLKVVQRGAGANMSVDVGAGDAWVKADQGTRNGLYFQTNDATVNVVVTAAHATLPRIDQAVLTVNDGTAGVGSGDTATLTVLAGTATSGATLDNRNGAAALGNNRIRLADILVPAASSSVVTANIRDRRPWARGFYNRLVRNGAGTDYSTTSSAFSVVDSTNLAIRFELAQAALVRLRLQAAVAHNVISGLSTYGFQIDGDYPLFGANLDATSLSIPCHPIVAGDYVLGQLTNTLSLAAGGHLMQLAFARETAGTTFIGMQTGQRIILEVEEITRQNVAN